MTQLVANIAAITHQGLVREHNEDVVSVNAWVQAEPLDEPQLAALPMETPIALIVCDGIGGHQAGEIASGIAARHLSVALHGRPNPETIAHAIAEANVRIFEAAEDPTKRSMGTTVAGLWISDERSFWFNVGDSSVIRFANGFALKLSLDDVAGEQRTGRLTQSLGGSPQFEQVTPHIGEEIPKPGWTYVVCSDGLTDMVPLSQIEKLLTDDPQVGARRLFEAAVSAGATDNVSLIIATITAAAEHDSRGA